MCNNDRERDELITRRDQLLNLCNGAPLPPADARRLAELSPQRGLPAHASDTERYGPSA